MLAKFWNTATWAAIRLTPYSLRINPHIQALHIFLKEMLKIS